MTLIGTFKILSGELVMYDELKNPCYLSQLNFELLYREKIAVGGRKPVF